MARITGYHGEMTDGNPYRSPQGESPIGTAATARRPPYVWSAVLLIVGSCFLLLLDGQVFTNTLVFLGLVAVSGVVWLGYLFRSRAKSTSRLGIGVLVLHVVLLIAFARDPPRKYRWQQTFNQAVNDALQRAGRPVE